MSKCPEELKELLKAIYNLSGSEVEVLYRLCKGKEERVNSMADSLNRNRSTIQRILNKLLSLGLIERESKTYEDNRKGRYYMYSIIDKDRLKEKIIESVKNWERNKTEVLESI